MPLRETGHLGGKALLALLFLVACWALCCGSAAAEIKLEEGPDKATTPHLEMDFGDSAGNVELVEAVKWSPVGGTLGSNLVANSGGGGCGVFEFWGESYPNQDGTGPAPVVAGQRGSWTAASNRTALIESASPHACSGNTPEIPVRTRYTFFDEGPAANTVRMERRISFAPNQERNDVVQGMRFYDPRLPAGTYNQEIFPNEAGTGLNTIGDGGPAANSDWNETWMAIDSSITHAGVVVFHQPDGVHTASVTSDNDGASGSNNSGVTLDRPALGWLEPVTETEYFCFYDATTWPTLTRSPTNLPEGCATPEVPVNVTAPKLSAGAGNPHLGETFQAEPGTWEHAAGGFTYQWFRCGNSSCTPIGGATGTSYTATGEDVGHPLKVRVTATAPGGETDYAESNIAGTVSGHVYEGEKSVAHELAGARVQICRLKGSPCRSTSTDNEGFYRLQAPSLGDYRVTAFPPAGSNAIARTRTTVTHVSAEHEVEDQDVVLPLPQPPPPSVHFTGGGVRPTNAEGVPVVYWQEPFEINFETAIENEVEAKLEFPDGLTQRYLPNSVEPKPGEEEIGIFDFQIQPLYPNHGAGRVTIVVHSPRTQPEIEEEEKEAEEEEAEEEEQEEEENEEEEPEEEPETPEEEEEHEKETEEEETEEREAEEAEEEGGSEEPGTEEVTFPIYIDPSGYVRLADGTPLEGATVKLFASESANGPFTLVPDGSAAMSAMNRHNPDATDAGGHFGWDVVAGFYKVRAEKSGCNAKGNPSQSFDESGVMTIPPPVENLDLRLECPTSTGPPSSPPPAGGSSGSAPRQTVRPRASLTAPRKLKVKVDRTGRFKLKAVKATCPADAAAPCTLKVVVKGLGSAASALPPSKTVAVSGKITKATVKRLRKAKRLQARLAVTVTVPNGDPAAATAAITLLRKG